MVCKIMTSSSGFLCNRQSVVNEINREIASIKTCFEEAVEYQTALREKQMASKEHFRSNCAQISDLDKELCNLMSEYTDLEKHQTEALTLKERLLHCEEGLTDTHRKRSLSKDSVAEKADRMRLINWYKEILGVELNRIDDSDVAVFGLTLSYLSQHVDASATLRFSLQDRTYKFLGSDPALPEDILKRSEEQLNGGQDFQAFLCYIRKQFTEALEVG